MKCILWLSVLAIVLSGSTLCSKAQNRLDIRDIRWAQWDGLGNIWVLLAPNRLEIRDHRGQLQQAHAFNRLSALTSIDLSNPLEAAVFFKNDGVVLLLDNTLSVLRRIDWGRRQGFGFSGMCRASQEGFWAYDPSHAQLVRIDNQGMIQERSNLDAHDAPIPGGSAMALKNVDRSIFVYNTSGGWWQCDAFGNVQDHWRLDAPLSAPFFQRGALCGIHHGEPACFQIKQRQWFNIPLPEALDKEHMWKGIHFYRGKWLAWTDEQLTIIAK